MISLLLTFGFLIRSPSHPQLPTPNPNMQMSLGVPTLCFILYWNQIYCRQLICIVLSLCWSMLYFASVVIKNNSKKVCMLLLLVGSQCHFWSKFLFTVKARQLQMILSPFFKHCVTVFPVCSSQRISFRNHCKRKFWSSNCGTFESVLKGKMLRPPCHRHCMMC